MNTCTILIVDDNSSNVKICREILEDVVKTIISAEDGKEGFSTAKSKKPDVILLDIMMPVMDGFQMLEKLQADPELKQIPVLMLTAKTGTEDVVKALNMGANDYLKKPFVYEELQARVETLCRLKKVEDRLKNTISHLEHKTELLAHKAEIGLQAGGLAHDFNNIMTITQLISLIPDMLDNPDKHEQIRIYIQTVLKANALGCEICHGYTSYLKDIGKKAFIQPIEPLFQPLSMYARQFQGCLVKNIPRDLPLIKCKSDQIKRVIINLFINACQAVGNREKPIIECKAWHDDGMVCFSVNDNGKGISEDILPHIFDECFTTRKNGTGLGLFMVKQIIESHGGTIDYTSEKNVGTEFIISLPAVPDVI